MSSSHDKKVKAEADKLRRQGYSVKADIPGYEKPDSIGKNGYVPDIVAKKTSSIKIIEIETPNSLNKEKAQQSVFRKSAAQKRGTTFDINDLMLTTPCRS